MPQNHDGDQWRNNPPEIDSRQQYRCSKPPLTRARPGLICFEHGGLACAFTDSEQQSNDQQREKT
jgi:hypothetical protein